MVRGNSTTNTRPTLIGGVYSIYTKTPSRTKLML